MDQPRKQGPERQKVGIHPGGICQTFPWSLRSTRLLKWVADTPKLVRLWAPWRCFCLVNFSKPKCSKLFTRSLNPQVQAPIQGTVVRAQSLNFLDAICRVLFLPQPNKFLYLGDVFAFAANSHPGDSTCLCKFESRNK